MIGGKTIQQKLKGIGTVILVFVLLLTMILPTQVSAATKLMGKRATASDVVAATSTNKKGIQGAEFWTDSNDTEFKNSVNHVYMNLELTSIINTDGTGTPYSYNGKTYYFNYENYVKVFEWRIRELRSAGKIITAEVLMGWTDNPQLQKLIYPGGREAGHFYYALNVQDADAIETLNATFHYLADVFGQSDCFIQNWILGNEVTAPQHYNYCGTYDANTNIDIAVKSFDLLYSAIQDNSPYAKVYICPTHNWNDNLAGTGIPTKTFIDGFAAKEKGKNWNIAYHAYPRQMDKTMWSKEAAADLSHDITSNFVCAANLEVLTDYIKNTYGSSHRIILSEQGFDAKTLGEEAQAASLAYLYYAAARNDMVDAMIYVQFKDNLGATGAGLYQGLVNADGTGRQAYNVFKYMDTPYASGVVDPYLRYITPNAAGTPISSWTDDIIWKAASTTATLTSAQLYIPDNQTGPCIQMAMSATTSSDTDLEYRWLVYDQSTGVWSVASGWQLNQNILSWYPQKEGAYLVQGEVRVAGNPSSLLTASTGYQYGTTTTPPVLSSVGIYLWQYENGLIEGGAVVNDGVDTSDLSYRWLVYDVKNEQWIQASDWSFDYGIHYSPSMSGDYLVYCEVKDTQGHTANTTVGVNYRHAIKAICQMPDPNGNGYLIGIQSFDNPGYYYEMQILDCNLYVQGKAAWIYTTGKCGAQDTTLWTTWAPIPGYYWTLFNLYDASGNLIDQQCYGFTNAE